MTEEAQMTGEAKPIALDASMVTSVIAVAAVAVVLSVGALFVSGWHSAMGVACGGLLATINLWLVGLVGRGVLAGGPRGRLWGLIGGVKVLALLGAVFLVLWAELTTGLTLAVGYVALPVGMALGTWLSRPRELPQSRA